MKIKVTFLDGTWYFFIAYFNNTKGNKFLFQIFFSEHASIDLEIMLKI